MKFSMGYWIVDPFEHSLDQLVLRDGEYDLLPVSDDVQLTIVDGVVVHMREVW